MTIAGTRTPATPAVLPHRRNHMVPTTAVFVVGDDDHAVLPDLAVAHGGHELSHVLLTRDFIRVTRMFVVGAERLDESHRRQPTRCDVREEVLFVLQMRARAGRGRIELRRADAE